MRCLNCQNDTIPEGSSVCPKCGAGLAQQQFDLLKPGTLLNNGTYRIDHALGRGGFGITYRGAHVALEQQVAIKEFYLGEFTHREGQTGKVMVVTERQDDYTRGLAKFTREGQTLASINHPNVVRVMNLFQENGTAYLIMEYLSGKNLKGFIKEHGRLPVERIHEIMTALVSALSATHRKNVYHLDIKPANVMMEPDGRVVLIDFGAARQNFSSATTVPAFTPSYAPFEVMSASNVGPGSDVFELGMLLHEMLTGALPPNALERMSNNTWQVPDLPQPWKLLLDTALPLRYEERPDDVMEWWKAGLEGRPFRRGEAVPPQDALSQSGAVSLGGGNYGGTGGGTINGGNTGNTGGGNPAMIARDGDTIRARAVLTEAQARNGGEAGYITERGERGTFKCPPNVQADEVLRLPGYGGPGRNGGKNGDLLISVALGNPGAFANEGMTKTGSRLTGNMDTVIGGVGGGDGSGGFMGGGGGTGNTGNHPDYAANAANTGGSGGGPGGNNFGTTTGGGAASGGDARRKSGGFVMVGALAALAAIGTVSFMAFGGKKADPAGPTGGRGATPTPKVTATATPTPQPKKMVKICETSGGLARSKCPEMKDVVADSPEAKKAANKGKCMTHAKICVLDGKLKPFYDRYTGSEYKYCDDEEHQGKLLKDVE